MKNVTLALPDEVYRLARIRAAELGTSVSALVAEHLSSLRAAEFDRLSQLQHDIMTEITEFRAEGRLSREEVHYRPVRR